MPNLNHKGPENLGPKTGNKLWKCRKTKLDDINSLKTWPLCKRRLKNATINKIGSSDVPKDHNQ
ncbi:hypothetical protein JCM19538_257 [Jejuia pallidilutea]|jgi:hypothetical protein|uniref:Uncharacterized protein n=1 Tax=Jejuia pallidilutea TaxID=504487 RepID=A0A098LVP9_9FLAO|nr:hypothetical protein JCM19538_257 [Jejuia pallidilutea]